MPDGSKFVAIIQAQLDTSKINTQLLNASKKWGVNLKIKNFTLDTRGLQTQIQNSLNGRSFTLKLSNVDISSLSNTITGKVRGVGTQAGAAFSQTFYNRIAQSGEMGKAISTVESKFNSLTSKIKSLNDSSGLSNEAHNKYVQLQTDLERLRVLRDEFFSSTTSPAQKVAAYDEFNATLTRVRNNLSMVTNETRQFASAMEVATLQNRMEAWMTNNSRATKAYGSQIQNLVQRLRELSAQGNVEKTELQKLAAEFNNVKAAAQAAGLTGRSFGSSITGAFKSISRYVGVATVIYRVVAALKQMYSNVLKIDTAMTGLKRVTNLSSSEYTQLFDRMTESAQKYGSTLEDIINSTTSWVKLGFDPDTAEQLAEVSAMYQHVTDLDYNTAVKNLVTAYKGYESDFKEIFGDDAVRSMTRIADIYDKLGNEMPVTAAQVGEGMTKAASIMQMSGATLEQAAGMITGGGSVTQDFDAFGNALKVSALRIRGMKGKLEELGEEVDDNVVSVSKMQTQILNLTHGKVNIFEADGETFRNIYDIYSDIAEIYDDLSDTDRSSLLELIAGKMRSNQIQAMIKNWSDVEKATEKAYNAEGTAAQENEKYMDSMQGKINATKAAWEALSNTFLSADLLKGFIDTGTGALNILNNIVSTLGSINTLVISIAAVKVFKNIS